MDKAQDNTAVTTQQPAGEPVLVYAVPVDGSVPPGSEEVDIFALLQVLWRRKIAIVGIVGVAVLIAVAVALLSTEWYQSDALLSPSKNRTERPSVGAGLDALGGLASFAGLSVDDSNSAESIAILESREFTASFIESNNLMPVLFADEWDESSNSWASPDDQEWPDIRDGIKLFDEEVRAVTQDTTTGLTTLSVTWTDPELAADWAAGMIDQLNSQTRDRAIREAEAHIEFIETEMSETNLSILDQSLGLILQSELESLMLAKGNAEYAFRVLDKPQVAKRPVRPQRILIVLLGAIFGTILAIFYVLIEFALKRQSGGNAVA